MSRHIDLVLRAIQYIEAHLTEPIDVKEVCGQVSMSPWQFQRLFRAIVGDSIGGYLRGRRLTQAAEQLLATDNRILDIAIEHQFASQESFTRALKSQFELTPGELRKNPSRFKLFKKPALELKDLLHIHSAVKKQPEIKSIESLRLTGQRITINSFLGERPDFEECLPKFWREFERALKGSLALHSTPRFGVATSEEQTMLEDKVTYLAGVPEESLQSHPPGFETVVIPSGSYAVFENVGLADKSLSTINYIYGIWLPNSEYKRAAGYDFEIFDERYSLDNPESISHYYLPVEKKTS